MKKTRIFLLTLSLVFSFVIVSNAYSPLISARNNIEATTKNKYPVIEVTNHSEHDIKVEWGAYGDAFQGDILIHANSTVNLKLEQLSFLGENSETTTVWLTWSEPSSLKPKGTDVMTMPFELDKVSPPEFG